MESGIAAPTINDWFGIEAPDERPETSVEPNYLYEEPEEQVERLTSLINEVMEGRLRIDWRLERMSSNGPIYRLLLDGRPTPIHTRTGKPDFHKEVSDLVAELNGWERKKLMWYRMGHASQLRLGYRHVNQCFDNMSFEDAVAAAVRFAGIRQVSLC